LIVTVFDFVLEVRRLAYYIDYRFKSLLWLTIFDKKNDMLSDAVHM